MKDFFICICDYIKNTFPINDEVLLHAEVADIHKRQENGFDSILFFIDNYPALSRNSQEKDELEMEFQLYQSANLEKITTDKKRRMDTMWADVGDLESDDGTRQFGKLSEVMLAILTIFHSNADCERIFSQIRKVKSEDKGRMTVETLNSILAHKCASIGTGVQCFEYKPPPELINIVKGITHRVAE